MSSSCDEEDFQSADEEVHDADEINTKGKQKSKPSKLVIGDSKSHTTEVVSDEEKVNVEGDPTIILDKDQDKPGASSKKDSDPRSEGTENEASQNTNDDGDDDEQEALAERIRERNLRIARKFSAELAKSVKSSAPIPVITSVDTKTSNSESSNIPGANSKLPPAPPPTPALSSSLNAEDQSEPSTQFAWRVPAKISTRDERSSSINKDDPMPRLALDRLSDTLSQTEKSIFEQVAEDLKKVAIKTSDTSAFSNAEGSLTDTALSAISSISDLGNTLGGWGWSGASKLISSASQVTSQVGSVIDSVVGLNIPDDQQLQQQQQKTQPQSATVATSSARSFDSAKVPETSPSDDRQ